MSGRHAPIKLWRTPDEWAAVRSKAVAGGSPAQMANVLEMALQDIATLSAALTAEISPWVQPKSLAEPLKFQNER